MRKLSDLIKLTVHTSPVDITCEVDTSHLITNSPRRFLQIDVRAAQVSMENMNAIEEPGPIGMPDLNPPKLSLRVCPICVVQFMGDLNNALGDLRG